MGRPSPRFGAGPTTVFDLDENGKVVKVAGKKRSKYGNKRQLYNGMWFDSKAELRDWIALEMRQRAGEIRNLRRQVHFPMVVEGLLITTLIADFAYDERVISGNVIGWLPVVGDTKGGDATQTPEFKIKAKLLKALHNIDIKLTGKGVK